MIFLTHNNCLKDRREYWYSEAPLKPSSRSGHCAILLPSLRCSSESVGLFVFGGRDSGEVEMCGQWIITNEMKPFIKTDSKKNAKLKDKILKWCHHVPEIEVMIGLRYHAMAAVTPDCVIVHGGEHFKSKYKLEYKLVRL